MATRNFDASSVTQRERDRVLAQNLYQSQINGTPIYRNKNRGTISEQIMDYRAGTESTYTTSDTGFMVENVGGVGNYFAPNLISPMPPTNLTYVVTLGDTTGQVTISFYPGQTDPYPIIGYGYSINNGDTFALFDPPQMDTPVTISDLTIGQTYYIGLKVMTTLQWSPSSIIIPILVALPPNAPVITTIDAGNQQVVVSFTLDFNGGSPITNYQYSTDEGVTYVPCSPIFTNSPLIITTLSSDPTSRLANNQTYSILIKAVNAAGVGAESNMVVGSTYTRPSPPTDMSSTPGNRLVQIAFTQPLDPTTGPITNYLYSLDDGASFSVFNPAQISSPFTITGLNNNFFYPIRFKAVNVAGISEESEIVSAETFTSPDPPTLTSSVPGNYLVAIYFTEGENNGGMPVINHMYSIDNGATFQMCCPAMIESPIFITGLMNNTTYQVVLKSVTDAGISDPSNPILSFYGGSSANSESYSEPIPSYNLSLYAATTPSNTLQSPTLYNPNPPTNLTSTPGYYQVTIGFTPGSDNGSPIINYKYSIDDGQTYQVCFPIITTSPLVIKGLTDKPSYSIRLKAISIVGSSIASDRIIGLPFTPPNPPTNLRGIPGNKAITIQFTPGSSNTPITNYQYSLNSGKFIPFQPATGNVSSFTINGLRNSSFYTIRLKTVSSVDVSIISDLITTSTLFPPSKPTITSITPGNKKLTIIFTPGANGGSAITGYQYSLNNSAYQTLSGIQSIPNSSNLTVDITGLVNNTFYVFTMRAINIVDAGAISDVATATTYTVPSPPTNITSTKGNQQVTIIFTPGAAGGLPINQYQYSINGGSFQVIASPQPVPNTSNLTAIITGLINNSTYSLSLRAVSDVGVSASSSIVSISTFGSPMPPILSSYASGNGQVTITFTPGDNGGTDIINYQYSLNGGAYQVLSSVLAVANSSQFTGIITGLINNTIYTITVKALTLVGLSNASRSLAIATLQSPSAPTSLSYTIGNAQLTISFTPGANGGSPILRYEYSTDGTTYSTVAQNNTTSVLITGLLNNTTYANIYLRAVTIIGPSPTASILNIVMLKAPSAPTNLSYTAGNAQVTIAFTPGANGGSPILRYEYSTNGTTYSTVAQNNTTSVLITGLPNNTTYATMYLRAISDIGAGTSATISNVSTLYSPSAPTSLTFTRGNAQVTLSFTPGATGGSPILRYEYSIDGANYASVAQNNTTSVLITGLTNNTTYATMYLRAVSLIGAGTSATISNVSTFYSPSAVTSLSFTRGDRQVTIVFTPGANGGTPIRSYQYAINGGSYQGLTTQAVPSTSNLSGTITGLTNNTTYSVSIIATNDVGSSTASTISASTSYSPSKPTNLAGSIVKSNAVITFTPGADNGTPIANYLYSLNGGGFTAFTPATGPAPANVTIYGLIVSSNNTIALKAVNTYQLQSDSSDIFTIYLGALPGAPNITSTNPATTSFTVVFTPPASNGGVTITKYNIYLNGTLNGSVTVSGSPSSFSYSILNLTPATQYNIGVSAVNTQGEGPQSVTNSSTAGSVPTVPIITSIVPSVNTVILYFNAPASNGGLPIATYYVYLNGTRNGSTTGTLYSIAGLTPATNYTIGISAINSLGEGPQSSTTFSTGGSLPGVPILAGYNAYVSQININFAAPASTGGLPITAYYVYLNGTRNGNTSGSPYLFSGLTPSTTYTIGVSAVNALGEGSQASQSITTDQAVPKPPSISVAAISTSQLNVSISAAGSGPGTSSFNVYRDGTNIGNIGIGYPAVFQATGLSMGGTYTFTATSVNEFGESVRSESVSGTTITASVPEAPLVDCDVPSQYQMTLYITPRGTGGSNITGYRIYSIDGGINATIAAPDNTSRVTYNLANIPGGGRLRLPSYLTWPLMNARLYRVVAINAMGNSPEGTISGSPPTTTVSLTRLQTVIVAGTTRRTTFQWTPASEPVIGYLMNSPLLLPINMRNLPLEKGTTGDLLWQQPSGYAVKGGVIIHLVNKYGVGPPSNAVSIN